MKNLFLEKKIVCNIEKLNKICLFKLFTYCYKNININIIVILKINPHNLKIR